MPAQAQLAVCWSLVHDEQWMRRGNRLAGSAIRNDKLTAVWLCWTQAIPSAAGTSLRLGSVLQARATASSPLPCRSTGTRPFNSTRSPSGNPRASLAAWLAASSAIAGHCAHEPQEKICSQSKSICRTRGLTSRTVRHRIIGPLWEPHRMTSSRLNRFQLALAWASLSQSDRSSSITRQDATPGDLLALSARRMYLAGE